MGVVAHVHRVLLRQHPRLSLEPVLGLDNRKSWVHGGSPCLAEQRGPQPYQNCRALQNSRALLLQGCMPELPGSTELPGSIGTGLCSLRGHQMYSATAFARMW